MHIQYFNNVLIQKLEHTYPSDKHLWKIFKSSQEDFQDRLDELVDSIKQMNLENKYAGSNLLNIYELLKFFLFVDIPAIPTKENAELIFIDSKLTKVYLIWAYKKYFHCFQQDIFSDDLKQKILFLNEILSLNNVATASHLFLGERLFVNGLEDYYCTHLNDDDVLLNISSPFNELINMFTHYQFQKHIDWLKKMPSIQSVNLMINDFERLSEIDFLLECFPNLEINLIGYHEANTKRFLLTFPNVKVHQLVRLKLPIVEIPSCLDIGFTQIAFHKMESYLFVTLTRDPNTPKEDLNTSFFLFLEQHAQLKEIFENCKDNY